jgi:ApaG protein
MDVLTTNGITVYVETQFLPDHSKPILGEYLFGYHIVIENGSPYTVQLLSRHWIIKDADGVVREVRGNGVIGLNPILAPGEYHQYSSYCNLRNDWGKMSGAYLMIKVDDGSTFEVSIPEFQLMAPFKLN